jgi:tetratricopeptide (TPR) repeat protein
MAVCYYVSKMAAENRAYRWTFAGGALVIAGSLVAGVVSVLVRERRLPGLEQDATAEGRKALARGDRVAAIREFREWAEASPQRSAAQEASENLAMAGDFAGAGAALDRMRRLDPGNPDMLTALGWVLFWQHRLDEAAGYFEMAVRANPRDHHAYRGLGETRIEQDRYAEAVAALERSVEIRPTEGASHNSLGIALALSGNRPAAVEHFAVAMRLTPDPTIAKNLERARESDKGQTHGR